MGQIPRSTERISSYNKTCTYDAMLHIGWLLVCCLFRLTYRHGFGQQYFTPEIQTLQR